MSRAIHPIQQQMIQLATEHDIVNMRLTDLSNLLGGIHLQQVKHHKQQLIKHGDLPRPDNPKKVTVTRYEGGFELVNIPILGIVS
jgi:hypothetical protein